MIHKLRLLLFIMLLYSRILTSTAARNQGTQDATKIRKDSRNFCKNLTNLEQENWQNHNLKLYQNVSKDNVTIYKAGWTWLVWGKLDMLLLFTSLAWEYLKGTYGNVGTDHCLNVILHNGTYPGGRISISNKSTDNALNLNILDVGSLYSNSWIERDSINDNRNLITTYLSYFTEYNFTNRYASPFYNVWKGSSYEHTTWVDIFTYDVYIGTKFLDIAKAYRNESEKKAYDFPRKNTFWMRDWFLPIYDNYGGNTVLKGHFQLLHDHTSPNHDTLNMGGFVHFWSAAAKHDLVLQAKMAFGWYPNYHTQLIEARQMFPKLNGLYFYNSSDTPFDSSSTTPSGSTQNKSQEQDFITIGICAGVGVLVVIIAVFALSILYFKKRIHNLKTEMRALTSQEVDEFFEGEPSAKNHANDDQALILSMPFIKDFEIPKDQIILAHDKVIGTGQFGYVLHGFVRFSDRNENELKKVAVKMVRPNVDVVYFKAFLSEVKIMAYLGKHENIVELLGTCTANIKDREILIALELCPLGSLLDYLKKNRHLFQASRSTQSKIPGRKFERMVRNSLRSVQKPDIDCDQISTKDLLKWSYDISNAMVYVKEKKVIHGDLASRNVLLTAHRTAKICDFGLSRQFLNYANYMKTSQTPVPWRWLAIECMKEQKYSTASDVWAYGVLMWEIFSLGETPYGLYTYDLFFVDKLISGERLLKPPHASVEIYELMQNCWKMDPEDRIAFQEIRQSLEDIIFNPVKQTNIIDENKSLDIATTSSLTVEVEIKSHL